MPNLQTSEERCLLIIYVCSLFWLEVQTGGRNVRWPFWVSTSVLLRYFQFFFALGLGSSTEFLQGSSTQLISRREGLPNSIIPIFIVMVIVITYKTNIFFLQSMSCVWLHSHRSSTAIGMLQYTCGFLHCHNHANANKPFLLFLCIGFGHTILRFGRLLSTQWPLPKP